MKTVAKLFVLLCLVASSLCNPIGGNVTGVFVECEITPESVSLEFIKQESEETRGGRVVYGYSAQTNQFPYYGYTVLYRSASTALCGSSLISTSWVLTAAHCMRDVRSGQVYFGSIDNQVVRVSQSISRYISHANYNPNDLSNDVALAQLRYAVPVSLGVQPIRLPTRSSVGRDFTGTRLTAAGFGRTATGSLPRYLQYTYVNGLSYTDCKAAHWVYSTSMICAKSALTSGSSICSKFAHSPKVFVS
jgi:secreted trypsin-like serine protease